MKPAVNKMKIETLSDFMNALEDTKPGELVLDPFAGSGTTLVACQETGRRTIGIEKEGCYSQIIHQRIFWIAL